MSCELCKSLNDKFDSLRDDLINLIEGQFDNFITSERQRYGFMQSEEGKIITADANAWKEGYKKGYEDCRQKNSRSQELIDERKAERIKYESEMRGDDK